MDTSLCYVTVTLKCQEKNCKHLFYFIRIYFSTRKCMFDTFTKNAHGTQRPTLPPSVFATRHYSHGCKLTGLFLNHDFEADVSQNVSLKIHNSADSYGFFDSISVYLKTIDHLNLKMLIFFGILQVLRFDFQMFRILEILNYHPCIHCNLTSYRE